MNGSVINPLDYSLQERVEMIGKMCDALSVKLMSLLMEETTKENFSSKWDESIKWIDYLCNSDMAIGLNDLGFFGRDIKEIVN